MEIKINKEIKEYNETIFFGLSVRQFVFSLIACGAAIATYFLAKPYFGTEVVSWLCMLAAAPFAAVGFVRYQGMSAEQVLVAWFRSEVLMPRVLTFRGENQYRRKQKGEDDV